jgi:hypothetical protein
MFANHKWFWDVTRWTLLILGIGKLLIVIAGGIQYILGAILLGIAFVAYLRKIRGEQYIARYVMVTALSVTVFSYLYDLVILLNVPVRFIMIQIVATMAFTGTAFLAMSFIKVKHVTP